MDSHAEARMNRMAAENVEAIHWLTWPIRELVGIVKTAIFLVLFIAAVPTIFIGLVIHFIVTGQSLLDADGVLALKVIFTFVAPFAVTIVYRFAQTLLLYAKGEPARSYDVRRRFVFSMHKIFLITLGLMLAGALCNFAWWEGMSTERDLAILVVYLCSPLLLLFVRARLVEYPRPRIKPQV